MNSAPPCFGFIGAGIVAKIIAILGFFATYSNSFAGISFVVGILVGLRTLYLSFKKKSKK